MPEVQDDAPEPVPQLVTNKSEGPLSFPGGEFIPSNAAVEIADWEKAQKHRLVKIWREEGLFEEGDTVIRPEEDETDDDFRKRLAEDYKQRREERAEKKREKAEQSRQ